MRAGWEFSRFSSTRRKTYEIDDSGKTRICNQNRVFGEIPKFDRFDLSDLIPLFTGNQVQNYSPIWSKNGSKGHPHVHSSYANEVRQFHKFLAQLEKDLVPGLRRKTSIQTTVSKLETYTNLAGKIVLTHTAKSCVSKAKKTKKSAIWRQTGFKQRFLTGFCALFCRYPMGTDPKANIVFFAFRF